MSLPLPQALRVLDQHQASDPTSAVQSLLTDHGLSATPAQMATLVATLTRNDTSASVSWSQGRPADAGALAVQEHDLADAIACEEARHAQIRGRSYLQAARDYFRDDWPRIWRRNVKEPWYWAGTLGLHGLLMAAGAAMAVHTKSPVGWGLLSGAILAQVVHWMCIGMVIELGRDHLSMVLFTPALEALKARQQTLEPWTPSAVELRLWRSAPEVHAQVAALMASPIGLRQGDRPMVEAWMRQALARDDAPDALHRFLQERP